jgi:hypothetical protein
MIIYTTGVDSIANAVVYLSFFPPKSLSPSTAVRDEPAIHACRKRKKSSPTKKIWRKEQLFFYNNIMPRSDTRGKRGLKRLYIVLMVLLVLLILGPADEDAKAESYQQPTEPVQLNPHLHQVGTDAITEATQL